jgi:hypothetical protein
MAAKGLKLLEKCMKMLKDCNLVTEECDDSVSLPAVVKILISTIDESHSEFTMAQCDSWARCASDLTLDKGLAVEALKLGILSAISRFLQRYKSGQNAVAGVSWADALISLHNLALLEDSGCLEALEKLGAEDLKALATNLSKALKPG